MSIHVDERNKRFTLQTRHSSYQMQVDEFGFLRHLYYGAEIGDADMNYMHPGYERSFSPCPNCVGLSREYSLDVIPQEYTGCGLSDFRVSSVGVISADGSSAAEFHYESYEIRKGKYQIPGQPAVFADESESQTLVITLQDPVTGIAVELLYGVLETEDVICRAARIRNRGTEPVILTKAASMCLDFSYGDFDLLNFHGGHAKERFAERSSIEHHVKVVRSRRGASSHQQNPFVILCEQDATEDRGGCYGFMLVYSGSFRAEVEKDQFDSTRVIMGIEPETFRWKLESGATFDTPEVILSFSGQGFTGLSQQYHRVIRNHLIRSRFQHQRRPVLLNSWEGLYFDYNEESILKLAEGAWDLGVELLVLDDGWFGTRNDDLSGLGDWYVNEDKIRCGLPELVRRINDMGLKFGIWVEPEMVNEDSELYRTHPDWAMQISGRPPSRSRNQLVLNLSKPEVREYLFESISKVLKSANIEYVKWDVNRNVTDLFHDQFPADRQGEVSHRHILGIYALLERFVTAFPNILFEGCSGGGGRFDAGMLYYYPQIWCSDDTDAIPRLAIQQGTSFGYPVSTMGSHVSACPNHQTGRVTPLWTRAVVAMHGTFGYELDPAKLSDKEKEQIRDQIRYYIAHSHVIQDGTYYRLTQSGKTWYEAWETVTEDRNEALLSVVVTEVQPNSRLIHLKLKGLDKEAQYRMEIQMDPDDDLPEISESWGGRQRETFLDQAGKCYRGAALMNGGVTLPWMMGTYPAVQIDFRKV